MRQSAWPSIWTEQRPSTSSTSAFPVNLMTKWLYFRSARSPLRISARSKPRSQLPQDGRVRVEEPFDVGSGESGAR
jgi:hypothetical protein